ncbi:hypothetical protein AB0F17_59430 [Nonomuraea sp. NPDC026600]|uniref:hypothetical protein n=1 Tax=Nonomuraea sp. NPDC026600 TaxID=3155363 RepID=UPI0033DA697E
MAVTYEAQGAGHVGTMTCDRECGGAFYDGETDTTASAFRRRAREAGWGSERPNAYQQWDVCPACRVKGKT